MEIYKGVIYFFNEKSICIYQESFYEKTKAEAIAIFKSHPYFLDGSAVNCTVKEIK